MGAAVAAVSGVGSVISTIGDLFKGSSTDGAKTATDARVALIQTDLAHVNTQGTPAHKAWIDLLCSSGDQSIIAEYRVLDGDPANKCGFGTQEGRDYAVAGVNLIRQKLAAAGTSTSPPTVVPYGGGLPAGSVSPLGMVGVSSSGMNTLLLVGAVVIVGVLLFRKRG